MHISSFLFSKEPWQFLFLFSLILPTPFTSSSNLISTRKLCRHTLNCTFQTHTQFLSRIIYTWQAILQPFIFFSTIVICQFSHLKIKFNSWLRNVWIIWHEDKINFDWQLILRGIKIFKGKREGWLDWLTFLPSFKIAKKIKWVNTEGGE